MISTNHKTHRDTAVAATAKDILEKTHEKAGHDITDYTGQRTL